jgi:dolichol-phosphate mannosyltransferase
MSQSNLRTKQHVVIAIPTYNEADCIEKTLSDLNKEIKNIKDFKISILVFDSNSSDKTVEKIKQAQKLYPNLHLEQEPQKTGLGSAYIQAMQFAMTKLNADIIFEFDADGSHQPKYIRPMLDKIKQGADVVVGSRYVKGGSMPKDWDLHRKLLSGVGNIIARCVLSPKYKDLTSGFRATKTSFLKKIDLPNLLSKDYAYKLQLFWELHQLKAKIVEHPIEFIDREKGDSKLPRNSIKDALRVVFTLRYRKLKNYIKMCCIGVSSLVAQLAIFNLLRLIITPAIANSIGVEVAVIMNFILNNHFTFKDQKIKKSQRKKLIGKFIQFNIASLGSMAIQAITVHGFIMLFGRHAIWENVGVITGILLGSVLNYFIYSRLIWKDNKVTEA